MKKEYYITDITKSNQYILITIRRLISFFFLFTIITNHSYSQQNDTVNLDSKDEIEVVTDSVDILVIEEAGDTTILKLKNKILLFIEYDERLVIDRIDLKTGEKKRVLDIGEKGCEMKKDKNKFR